jgi:hypothetical protein
VPTPLHAQRGGPSQGPGAESSHRRSRRRRHPGRRLRRLRTGGRAVNRRALRSPGRLVPVILRQAHAGAAVMRPGERRRPQLSERSAIAGDVPVAGQADPTGQPGRYTTPGSAPATAVSDPGYWSSDSSPPTQCQQVTSVHPPKVNPIQATATGSYSPAALRRNFRIGRIRPAKRFSYRAAGSSAMQRSCRTVVLYRDRGSGTGISCGCAGGLRRRHSFGPRDDR